MSKTLNWLHLSDIHFHPRTEWRDSIARDGLIEHLGAAFEDDESFRPDLIFCTGDIAFGETGHAPLTDQFAQAVDFFDRLRTVCGSGGTAIPRERLFVVPGNHDVNRHSINSDAQAHLTTWAGDAPRHVGTINQRFADRTREFREAAARLHEFSAFVRGYLPHQDDPDGRLFYTRASEINGVRVGIAGFNSAWSCAGPEDDRTLWMAAEWQFNSAFAALRDTELRIGLIHHPIGWLNAAERDTATRRISTDFDFWLHGHEHIAWVEPTTSHVTIAAGAVGAQSTTEFGVNLVRLNLTDGSGTVYLRQHKAGDRGWTIAPVDTHAPSGHWTFPLPARLRIARASPELTSVADGPSPRVPPKRVIRLYGRDALLDDAAAKLSSAPFLLVYGLRGNGKSALIEELGKRGPLVGKGLIRLVVNQATTADEVFRQLAPILGETAEFPKTPQGNPQAIADAVRGRCPELRPAWIWLDQAHHLFGTGGFRRPEVRNLLLGLQAAMGAAWHWVFELRERPPQGLFSGIAHECAVPGLNKASLGECLADAAPPGREADWELDSVELKRVYRWLGGGVSENAHPHATQLLIEIALSREETPLQVLERHREDLDQRIEDVLLADLYANVLDAPERRLLEGLALYRAGIPHDHADALERQLELPGAWDGLDRRCLLALSTDQHQYFLHSFIAGWLRTHRLGYAGHGEDDEAEFAPTTNEATKQVARELHSGIATCWLDQLRGSRRPTNINIMRAMEAFHHLVAAGEADRVQGIAVELLHGNLEWARRRMKDFYDQLFRTRAPVAQQLAALRFRAVLDPDDHAVQRFLGEAWQKTEGRASDKALACFKNACRLRRDYPHYWANLGRALLARGKIGAADFLSRLKSLERDCPEAINDHVRSIQFDCLGVVGSPAQAASLRMEEISRGSLHPAFYNDEAKARLDSGDATGALELLDLAEKRGCANDFTKAIRASALQRTDPAAAAALRMEEISWGSRNPVFYNDEAKARLDSGDATGALEILDLAEKHGCADDVTRAIRASALQRTDPAAAAALRMEEINRGSHHPAFYTDEAKARLDSGDATGALELLDLAEKRGCAGGFTTALRGRVEKALRKDLPV